jgi:hypothetical protein
MPRCVLLLYHVVHAPARLNTLPDPRTHASRDSDWSARVPGLTFYFFSAHNIFSVDGGRSGRHGPSYDEEPARRPPRSSPSGSAAAALRRERHRHRASSFPQQRNLPPLPQQGSHVWSSCPRSGAAPAPNPVSLLRFLGVVLAREARVRLPARRPRASGFRTAVAVGQGDTADLPLRQVACRAHASLGNPWPLQADHAR